MLLVFHSIMGLVVHKCLTFLHNLDSKPGLQTPEAQILIFPLMFFYPTIMAIP